MIALFLIVISIIVFLIYVNNKKITKKKDTYVVVDPDGDINTTTSRSVFETYIKDAEKKGK